MYHGEEITDSYEIEWHVDGSFSTQQRRKKSKQGWTHDANHRRAMGIELGGEVQRAIAQENPREPWRPVFVGDGPYDWLHERVAKARGLAKKKVAV